MLLVLKLSLRGTKQTKLQPLSEMGKNGLEKYKHQVKILQNAF